MAQESIFIMGDLKDRSLFDIWECPNYETQLFRNEYLKKNEKCRKCKIKRLCGTKNCRVEEYRLTGDMKGANPYTCIAVKEYEREYYEKLS